MSHLFDDEYDDAWRYERFITTIQQRAGISWSKAERAAQATLETLAERLSSGAARDLARDLPGDVARWLEPRGDAEPFGAVEFVRRVAEREGTDPATAEHHARAVLVALARLVRGDEIAELIAELPKDYAPLVGEAARRRRDPTAPEPLPYDVILDRVEGRAGLDRHGARRALEAVLETLAERIAGGEVDDLADALPDELRPPLERGRDRTGGKAQRMSLDEFVARVAEREGVSRRAGARPRPGGVHDAARGDPGQGVVGPARRAAAGLHRGADVTLPRLSRSGEGLSGGTWEPPHQPRRSPERPLPRTWPRSSGARAAGSRSPVSSPCSAASSPSCCRTSLPSRPPSSSAGCSSSPPPCTRSTRSRRATGRGRRCGCCWRSCPSSRASTSWWRRWTARSRSRWCSRCGSSRSAPPGSRSASPAVARPGPGCSCSAACCRSHSAC